MAGKPRFLVGEVVAWVASGGDGTALAYYQVAAFFYDQENTLRYTFRPTDNTASSLCPVEECIRKLTAREIGRTRKPPSGGKPEKRKRR